MRLPEWDDPDRRDAALERVAARIAASGPPLTPRQVAVVFLMSHGMSHAMIARTLGISPETVAQHSFNLRERLDARTAAHAVATALRLGLIS